MQSFVSFAYLYDMKLKKHLLLLVFLGCATTVWSGDTYAVLISGGRSKMFNHERYWNDCAFLYHTLRHTYHLPQDHITLLMADGNNAADDMLLSDARGFVSSPLDLDGDGQADLALASTRQNLEDTFCRLSQQLTSDAHLFVFITDHGELSADGSVGLWLWGTERLSPDELAAMINQCHPATMNILMGQCYAEAFAAPLQRDNRIITTACGASQMSWSCKDRPYDEFVYHWTCAIARHDEQGTPIDSDLDGDGHVSMQEAFDYARRNDRQPETPHLVASPALIASQWAFDVMGAASTIEPPTTHQPQPTGIYDMQGRER